MQPLPIDEILEDIVALVREHRGVVIEAPPGAGKSTRVPPALLDAGLSGGGQIWMLEPRRVAARATARRIAAERGVKLGEEVGYQVRFDRKMGPKTKLAVVTEGILTRKMQDDPFLEGINVVIVDEFHERSLHTDLGIAFLKEAMEAREDLHVVVMSATMRAEPIAEYLGLPSMKSEGRTFPVEVDYLTYQPTDAIDVEAARAVRGVVAREADESGDILVFLPGRGEIHRMLDHLREWGAEHKIDLLPLYSALPPEEQDRAILPGNRRRVIGATNIAETSLTIEGVTVVIDSGLVRQMQRSDNSGLDKLTLTQVSLASADQRAGRAGRVRPGRALRLWMKAREHSMREYELPEIMRVDLSALLLEIIAWSHQDPAEFPFFEAPPIRRIEEGTKLLRSLGALEKDSFRLSEEGRGLLGLPVAPRVGRMLLEGIKRGVERETAGVAALVSEGDYVLSVDDDAPTGVSDLLLRAEFLDDVAKGRTQVARRMGFQVHRGRARRVLQVRDQLLGLIERRGPDKSGSPGMEEEQREEQVLRALLAGFPDRIAMRREKGENRFIMIGGVPMSLARESIVRDARWILALVIAGETRARENVGALEKRALIRLASALDESWIREAYPEEFQKEIELSFHDHREQVMAEEVERFAGIEISRDVVSTKEVANPEGVLDLLKKAALPSLSRSFGLSREMENLLIRWELGRRYFQDAQFPKLLRSADEGEGETQIWNHLLWGKRSFQELKRINLKGTLFSYLTSEQRRILEEEFPERIEVPSGSKIKVDYHLDESPVLAVRIQEVFGWTETPLLARGQLPLLLHLLAPNYRPAQVTADLAGFWERTYPEVRKELRARYSKHPWPEDPLKAKAVYK